MNSKPSTISAINSFKNVQQILRLVVAVVGSGLFTTANAQQDPIYAQYMNNPLAINPAYAGSNNMFNANIQYRTQWAGIDANPATINFSSHMAVFRNKIGAGLMVIQDKIGDTKNTEFQGVFAYKIQVKDSWLSFGMQTGFIRYQTDPSMLTIRDPGDPAFNQLTETKFNTGVGIMLKSDRYLVGISVPRLLPATVSQGGQSIALYSQNYYLFGSYVMFISQDIRFKPSVLLRATQGTSISADLNASFTFKELYTGGIFTRNFKSYGILAQASFKNIRFGYVFELPGSAATSLNFVSHEVSLGISTALLGFHDQAVKTF
ncbi:MAG: type IX secretion system membrane protein PorP/SprF [Cytophagales bacterium]|nr:type IX secretion system membrane protein PorP/SprF [Cytophagales bacterium]